MGLLSESYKIFTFDYYDINYSKSINKKSSLNIYREECVIQYLPKCVGQNYCGIK